MIAAAPKTATVELISLPEKSFSRTADGRDASEIFGSMELRNEELRRLQYEDERRLMVISELEMQRQLQYTQQLLAHQARTPTSKMKASKEKERQIATPQTGGYVSSGSSGSSGHRQSPVQQSHLDHIKPSTLDFDAAMKWLMKPRGLTLVDRHPREFNFELTPMEGNNNRTLPVDSYSLEWRDTGSTSSSVFVAGLVVIGDISTIQSQGPDPASFTVVLKDTTRALKNSRGRTAITLKCSTAAECAKYYSSLMTVLRHLSAGY